MRLVIGIGTLEKKHRGKTSRRVNNGDGYEREAAPAKCRLRREREKHNPTP